MSLATVMKRFTERPPKNVGGGDLLTRMLATLGLLLLVVMMAPQAAVPYALLKISLLVASELGLMSMMLGLFLRSKTYYAGFQLFFVSLGMLWFASRQAPWVGMVVGLIFIVIGITNIVSRRSRFNAVLEISSRRVPLEEIEAAAAAEAAHPVAPTAPALKPVTNGGTP